MRHIEQRNNGGKKVLIVLLILVAVIAVITVCLIFPIKSGETIIPVKMTDDIVITLHGDKNTQVLKGEEYIEAGAYAIDKNEGPVAKSVEIIGNVDTKTSGTMVCF